ncbi:putative purine nucleoside permease [Colletotrichum scovillei]|uniref:Purine nucleoside permease n=1 Tax=Colletotrichum scovillei TaxID=1209932 RepID=A0A9P7R7B4_9PEZI|nr:putative purine nucleoside permease [Colletotrichum scovillei]
MATAGSECLENQNSTDCLLRALLNIFAEQKQAQDAGIDWDPITFGFTLLIGLVASMIALATVFQAVLAGGKGGRRANARAIGRWSKRTTRKWIFSEMSWSYTAFTPILRLKELEQGIEEITRLREEERENPPESGPSLSLYSKIVMWVTSSKLAPLWVKKKLKDVGNLASDVAPYPATWLGLFKATGLEGFDNEFDLTPVTADYLPDDFIAVPASAEVGAIVVITAAAGVQRLDVDTDLYPVIIGCNFQFDFRQHPVLGVIGAFSEHRRRGGNSHMSTPTLEKLREAGKHSNGTIELRNIYDIPEFNMLQGKGGQTESMAQEGLFEVPDVANPTSEKPGQQQPPLTAQGIHYKMLQALGSLIDGFDLGKDTLVAALKIRHDSTGHLIHLRSHLSDELFSAPSRQVELQLTSEDKEHLRHFQRQLEDTTFPIERLIGSEYDMPSTFFNTYQVLSRLATVLGRQPKSEDQNKWKTRPNEKIDDMIIYRSLLIGVLFNTALDNSKLLESGLWDRVVPVI